MTATSTAAPAIPGYLSGTWNIDPVHSEVSFVVRHLMVSKVRGRFANFSGRIVTAPDPLASSVEASVDLASVDTAQPDRDAHVRSADFFDVENYPEMTFRSTSVRPDADGFLVDGELSLHGVTRPVSLQLELNGFQPATPFGDTRVGFSATAEIDRRDFGVEFNAPIEGGGVVVGNKVSISLEIEAIRQEDAERS
jgi:polyisoprenoid-binding protein YceI